MMMIVSGWNNVMQVIFVVNFQHFCLKEFFSFSSQSLQRAATVKMILFDRKRRKLLQTPTLVVRLEALKVSVSV